MNEIYFEEPAELISDVDQAPAQPPATPVNVKTPLQVGQLMDRVNQALVQVEQPGAKKEDFAAVLADMKSFNERSDRLKMSYKGLQSAQHQLMSAIAALKN